MYQKTFFACKTLVLLIIITISLPIQLCANTTYAGLSGCASVLSGLYWYSQNKPKNKLEKQQMELEKKLKDKKITDGKQISQAQKQLKKTIEELKRFKRNKRVAQFSTVVSGLLTAFFLLRGEPEEEPHDTDDSPSSSIDDRKKLGKPYKLVFPPDATQQEIDAFKEEHYFERFTASTVVYDHPKYELYNRLRKDHEPQVRRIANRITDLRRCNAVMSATSPLLQDHARFINTVRDLYENNSRLLVGHLPLWDSGITNENLTEVVQNHQQLQAAIDEYRASLSEHSYRIIERERKLTQLDHFTELKRNLEQLSQAAQLGAVPQEIVQQTAQIVRELVALRFDALRLKISHIRNEIEYIRKRHFELPREILATLNSFQLVDESVYDEFLSDQELIERAVIKIEKIIDAMPAIDSETLMARSLLPIFASKNPQQIVEIISQWPIQQAIKAVKELQVSPLSHLEALEVQEVIDALDEHWLSQGIGQDHDFDELLYYSPSRVNELRSIPTLRYIPEIAQRHIDKWISEHRSSRELCPMLCVAELSDQDDEPTLRERRQRFGAGY